MGKKLKNNPKIKIGTVKIKGDITDTKEQKLRITTWLDGDIYDELVRRAEAGAGKGRYQTLLNEILRASLFSNREEPKGIIVHNAKGSIRGTPDWEIILEAAKKVARNEVRDWVEDYLSRKGATSTNKSHKPSPRQHSVAQATKKRA